MRKRSCALHSQTQDQYLELAQIVKEHTGIYYDDNLTKIVQQKQSRKKQPYVTKDPYINFDFNCDKIEDNQEQDQIKKFNENCEVFEFVVITSKVSQFKLFYAQFIRNYQQYRVISSFQDKQGFINSQKTIDLMIIHNKINKRTIKLWLISYKSINNTITKCYLQKLKLIYLFYEFQSQKSSANNLSTANITFIQLQAKIDYTFIIEGIMNQINKITLKKNKIIFQ